MKIGVFGNFGWGNLGNSATLEAALAGVCKQWPQATVVCICTNPQEVRQQYGLEVAPIRWDVGEGAILPLNRVARVATKLVRRPPSEWHLWQRARQVLHELDLLIVAGTGVLDDFAIGPLDLPYDLFKWSVQARRGRIPLVYLSTGAGPIIHRLSRTLIRSALRQAQYRSYRDEYSRDYLSGIGFDTSHDPVYPDLAFGLPVPGELLAARGANDSDQLPVIGLGVMSYSGHDSNHADGETVYQAYLANITHFGRQLLAQGHSVRLLLGDTLVDQRAVTDVYAALAAEASQHGRREHLIASPIHTVQDLLQEMAQTDLVIATRFHNVLLALLMEKPVLSISYNQKNDDLMKAVGLATYCQPIQQLNVPRLSDQLNDLQANAKVIRQQIAVQKERQKQLVEEQYASVAEFVGAVRRPPYQPT